MANVRVLAVGDIHATAKNYRDIEKLTKELVRITKETRPSFIVILGDAMDSFEKISLLAQKVISDMFWELSVCAEIYYVIGNHDILHNKQFLEEYHAFVAFSGNPKINIISQPHTHRIGGLSFGFVPYVPNGRFNEAVGKLDDLNGLSAIFAHQEFYGASFGHLRSENGDRWAHKTLVVSGHIHTFADLQSNIHYVGTPYQESFGDDPNKTVSVYDFTENGYTRERIPVNMPRKFIQEVSATDVLSSDFSNLGEDQIKLVVSGTTEEIEKFKHSDQYKTLPRGVRVVFKSTSKSILTSASKSKTYMELISDAVNKESDAVQYVFKEIVNASISK